MITQVDIHISSLGNLYKINIRQQNIWSMIQGNFNIDQPLK